MGETTDALEHIVPHRHRAVVGTAVDESYARILARVGIDGHIVGDFVAHQRHIAAVEVQEDIGIVTVVVDDQVLVLDGVANQVDGVASGTLVLNRKVVMIVSPVAVDAVVDDLVVFQIDVMVDILGRESDEDATRADITHIEFIVPQVEVARGAAVTVLQVVGEE